jgi:hypothetical protein
MSTCGVCGDHEWSARETCKVPWMTVKENCVSWIRRGEKLREFHKGRRRRTLKENMRLAKGVRTTSNTNRTRELDTEGGVTRTEGDRSKGIIATSDPHRRPKGTRTGRMRLCSIFLFAAALGVCVVSSTGWGSLTTPKNWRVFSQLAIWVIHFWQVGEKVPKTALYDFCAISQDFW